MYVVVCQRRLLESKNSLGQLQLDSFLTRHSTFSAFLFQVLTSCGINWPNKMDVDFVYLLHPTRLAFFLFQPFSQPTRCCLYQTIPALLLGSLSSTRPCNSPVGLPLWTTTSTIDLRANRVERGRDSTTCSKCLWPLKHALMQAIARTVIQTYLNNDDIPSTIHQRSEWDLVVQVMPHICGRNRFSRVSQTKRRNWKVSSAYWKRKSFNVKQTQ